MKIYNSYTREIEEFIPFEEGHVSLYTCGPTVYNYAHIGNLRTYIFEDILEKTFEYIGYKVKRVMNITDVGHIVGDADEGEDKMLFAKEKEKKTALEIADFYTEAFKKDCVRLNIKWPEVVEKATDQIDEYIKIIEKLLEKGYAYEVHGNIYFDISKANDYYQLSGKNPNNLIVGAREGVELDESKRSPFDFVLWFTDSKFGDQELKWDSPFGYGYPGWHIECSAIAIKNLGEYLDIHTGAVDAIFPHHTNEIAQSEAYLGHKWCNYWMHGEFLNDKTGKMSKSKGDFLTLNGLIEKGYKPIEYRYFCLLSHYRNQLVFSYDAIDNAKSTYNKLKTKVLALTDDDKIDLGKAKEYYGKFKTNLENDLNIASNITLIHDLLKDNTVGDVTKKEIITDFEKVLSLDLFVTEEIDDDLKEYVKSKLDERNKAKENKDYVLADRIREELLEKGIIIKDMRDGTVFERI